MKDHVKIGHLTRCDAFRVNRDQVMGLKYGPQSIQTSLIWRQRSPSHIIKLLKSFISSVTTVKSRSAPTA